MIYVSKSNPFYSVRTAHYDIGVFDAHEKADTCGQVRITAHSVRTGRQVCDTWMKLPFGREELGSRTAWLVDVVRKHKLVH